MKTKKANSGSKTKTIRMKNFSGRFVVISLEGERFDLRPGDLVLDMAADGEPSIVIGFNREGEESKIWLLQQTSGKVFDFCNPKKWHLLLEERPKKQPSKAREFRKLLKAFRRGYD